MSGTQSGAWLLTLFFSVFLAIVLMLSPKARVMPVFAYGVAFVCFGLATSCLLGKQCVAVITLEDAAGFGRAYGVGVAMIIAGILLSIKKVITKAFNK